MYTLEQFTKMKHAESFLSPTVALIEAARRFAQEPNQLGLYSVQDFKLEVAIEVGEQKSLNTFLIPVEEAVAAYIQLNEAVSEEFEVIEADLRLTG